MSERTEPGNFEQFAEIVAYAKEHGPESVEAQWLNLDKIWMPDSENNHLDGFWRSCNSVRYRKKKRKLAAPWREIDSEAEYSNVIVIDAAGTPEVIDDYGLADGFSLIDKGFRYYMSLDVLPPLWEGE